MVSPHLLDPYFSGLSAAGTVAVTKFGPSLLLGVVSIIYSVFLADRLAAWSLCFVLSSDSQTLGFSALQLQEPGHQSTCVSVSPEAGCDSLSQS